jgi:hypothetical protein
MAHPWTGGPRVQVWGVAALTPLEFLNIFLCDRWISYRQTHGFPSKSLGIISYAPVPCVQNRFPETVMSQQPTESEVPPPDPVIKAEADAIKEQRKIRLPEDINHGEPPGAVGLALSGGGIRSATFGLGVIQALTALKLRASKGGPGQCILNWIDYVSTVSGGGYIGSWLVANRQRRRASGASPDFASEEGSPSINHLRRYSRYLAPEAGFTSADTWTMISIWLRNTILIQAMVFCMLAACLLAARAWLPAVDFLSNWTWPVPEWVCEKIRGPMGVRPFPFMIFQYIFLMAGTLLCLRELKQYDIDRDNPPEAGPPKEVPVASPQGNLLGVQGISLVVIISAMLGASGLHWRALQGRPDVLEDVYAWLLAAFYCAPRSLFGAGLCSSPGAEETVCFSWALGGRYTDQCGTFPCCARDHPLDDHPEIGGRARRGECRCRDWWLRGVPLW